jgi:hypothetical protein
MATIDHGVLSTKTLSAPNPISMVYKKFAFFDDNTNTLRFTHSGTLFDLEIKKIHNNLTFTNTINVEGNFGGALPTAASTDAIISGSVSQLFSDMYSGAASGQVVDSEDFTPAASDYVFVDGNVDIPGGSKYGILHSLKLEADKRYERDGELDANQQSIETFLVGAGSGWTHDNTITFNSIVDTEAPYFLSAETSLAGAMQKIDAELKNLQSFVTSMWNEVAGSDQSMSEPSPGGLISPTWENDLFSMGSGVGSASTYYLASTGNVFIPRPDGTSNSESINSVSSRSAFLELDKELRRNEVWNNKINKYITGDNLNSESDSGGALAFSQDTTQWTSLTNVPSDGTYFRPWNPLAQAPTGIVPTNLSQALRNLDANIRMIKHRADINYRADGTNVGLMSDNPNRGNIQDLRADINAISNSFNNDSANSTSSGGFAYVPEANEYATSDSIGLAINQLDDNLEKLSNKVSGLSTTDGYSSIVPGSVNVEQDINYLYMEGWQTTNSLNNRLGKVVDSGSNIVITDHADTSDNKFIRYPAGQDFSGAPNDPAYGLTGSDWGKYLVNKNYVDGVTNGLIYRPWVRLVSNTNLDLNGSETIDGVATVDGDRILCINQTTTTENGVYVANHSGAWDRADDMDTGDTALRTWTFWIDSGTAYGNKHLNVSGDTTTYTVGTNAMTGWTIITRVFGLQNGIGTTSDTDRFDVNAGKSLYTDGTDGSTLNVNIAGYSGTYSGSPHSDAWSYGNRSNQHNPIQYLDGAGQSSGLTLKYTSDFSLSGSGELQIDEVGGITGSGIVWSYDTSKYAESATPGDSGSGSTSLFWGDASDGANRWARLRAFADESTAQGANLGTDGKPEFAALGIGKAADTGEPGGANYILDVSDSANTAMMRLRAETNEDAAVAFWTGVSNEIRGAVGYDHGDSVMKLVNATGLDSNYDLCIDSSNNVGIGTATPTRRLHVAYENSSAQLTLERVASDGTEGNFDIGADSTGLHFWANGYGDSDGGFGGEEVLFKPNGEIATRKALNIGPNAIGSGVSAGYSLEIHGDSGAGALMSIEADAGHSAALIFRDPSSIAGGIGHLDNATYDLISLTHGTGINTDAGLHIDQNGSIGFGTRTPAANVGNNTSSSYWQFGNAGSSQIDYHNADQCDKMLVVASNVDQDIVGMGLYVSDGGSGNHRRAQWILSDKTGALAWNHTYSTGPPTYSYQWQNASQDIMRISPAAELDVIGTAARIHIGDSDAANASDVGPYISLGDSVGNAWSKIGHFEADKHLWIELDPNDVSSFVSLRVKGGDGEILRVSEYNNGTVAINSTGNEDADSADLTVHGQSADHASFSLNTWKDTGVEGDIGNTRSIIDIESARGTQGSPAILADEDFIGQVCFNGYTGNASHGGGYAVGASIRSVVEGTPDAVTENNLPSYLSFRVNAGGSHKTPLKIHSDGKIQVGDTSSTPDAKLHVKANGYTKQLRLERTGSGPWKADIGVKDLGTNDEVLSFYANEGYDNTIAADGVFTNNATHYMKKNGEFWSKGSIFVGGAGAITLNTSGLITTNNIDVATHAHLKTGADLKMSTTAIPGTASPIIENTDDTGVSINSLGGQLKLGHRTCSAVKLMVDLIDSSGQTLIDESAREFAGTAAKAAQLETARTIGGVSFSGASNINLPGVNTQGGYADYVKSASAASSTDYYIAGFANSGGHTGQELYNDGDIKFNSNGDLFCEDLLAAGDVVCNYSDERLKNIKGNIESPLDKIATLNGFYYTPNDEAVKLGVKPDKEEVGVSAQEVAAIMPEAVAPSPVKSPTEEYLTVKYERLVPLLIESIKELKAEIDELKRNK